ncbi:hypothetical protein [Longispora albida]|uniref:hypothetical protein n=1 Tax=Longispora albida TaxID=203523 RepID=UPI000364B8DB|nr:hypothetical protein [Longispora albida]
MTRLETGYRRLLRLLPGWYRAEREEEMTADFLEGRDPEELEHGAWPGWREVIGTVGLAARTRLAAGNGPASARALGDGVRLFALLGLALNAALTLPALAWGLAMAVSSSAVPFSAGMAGLLALPALAALLTGYPRLAKVLAFATLIGPASVVVEALMMYDGPVSDALTWLLLAALPALALAAGYHADVPRVPVRPALIVSAGVVAMTVLSGAAGWVLGEPRIADPVLYALVGAFFLVRLRDAGLLVGVSLLASVLAARSALWMVPVLDPVPGAETVLAGGAWLTGVAGLAGLSVVAVVLAIRSASALRRLERREGAEGGVGRSS